MDWIKALLLGVSLMVGLLAIPILIAILVPAAAFGVVVLLIWFLLKVFKEDDGDGNP